MAYKLVCIHEFFDDISGQPINRGQEITDYDHMAKLVAANREHQFVKVQLLMADNQWEWPPVVGEPTKSPAPAAAAEPETIAVTAPVEE